MMRWFRKKPIHDSLEFIGVDFHSHLIPGIDDGSRSLEESISMISFLTEQGIQQIITSPHVYKEYFDNTRQEILTQTNQLNEALEGQGISIRITAAAEYFLDQHFMSLLSSGELMTFGSNYVLFELSFIQEPPILFEAVFELGLAGYRPILAHPERYVYLTQTPDTFHKLKAAGCLFQANLMSFTGYYGKEVRKLLNWLLKHQMIDFVCTDLHHVDQILVIKQAVTRLNGQTFRNRELLLN